VNAADKTGGGAEDAAAEDDLFRIEGADQIGHGHSPMDDGLVEDAPGQGVALIKSGKDIRALELCRSFGAQRAPAGGVGGEILPGDPGKSVAGGVVFKAAACGVLLLPGLNQSHPADGPGDIIMAAQDAAIDEDTGADTGADREKDGVAAAARRSLPGLAEDVAGAVAVDADRGSGKGVLELVQQRIVVPTGDVGRPDPAPARIIDARNAEADGGDFVLSNEFAGGCCDQRADCVALAPIEQGALPVQEPTVLCKAGRGNLGAAQIKSQYLRDRSSSVHNVGD